MSVTWRFPCVLVLVALLLVMSMQPCVADESVTPDASAVPLGSRFGGPNSVADQLAEDVRPKQTITGRTTFRRYFAWKDRLQERYGLSYSVDYTAAVLAATNTLGTEDVFASGAFRFYGSWTLFGRRSGNTGTFVWKVEHRHRYTDTPVSGTASQIGYVGAILPVLSDIQANLTNLYWKQNLCGGRVEIVAGFLDATDWVDVYALAAPWNGFFNFAFATGGASMPLPDNAALGLYVNAMLTRNVYVIGGFADSNADSTDPFRGFDTFANDREFFKTLELGWTTAQDRFYLDNTHLTFWHADERDKAGISSGWGLNFSFTHSFGEKWMPFVRAGYADGGGTLLQKTVSTGLAYHFGCRESLLGLGLNWGQPNDDTFGPGLDDQFTVELFSRLQVTQTLQVTPDIQWILDPARNPDADQSWVFGLRARVVF